MNELLKESVYFGVGISILAYWIGVKLKQKWNYALVNPLLIGVILIISVLAICHIDYETYDYGAKYITYFLTPATVCFAVPLYRQVQVLKKHMLAVFAGILCGCITHVLVVIGIALMLNAEQKITLSILPKSVTTPIALGVCSEINGISAITVAGVMMAGLMGAVIGPSILALFKIKNPIAQGLAIGTASHAVGTSKAVEMGEVQAAMSSLAIVVTGLMTVIIVPIVIKFLA